MARIRTVKPDYFSSGKQLRCSVDAAFLNISLWNHADDEGRLVDDVMEIGARCPRYYSATGEVVEKLLDELEKTQLIHRYEVDGKKYIQCHDFDDHQSISHPKKSMIPVMSEHSGNIPGTLPEHSGGKEGRKERKGRKEGRKEKVKDPPPSPNNFGSVFCHEYKRAFGEDYHTPKQWWGMAGKIGQQIAAAVPKEQWPELCAFFFSKGGKAKEEGFPVAFVPGEVNAFLQKHRSKVPKPKWKTDEKGNPIFDEHGKVIPLEA